METIEQRPSTPGERLPVGTAAAVVAVLALIFAMVAVVFRDGGDGAAG